MLEFLRFYALVNILTNAVKVYVPEEAGKRADQLGAEDYERHRQQWLDELDAMAEHGALPHVIAIIGAPFWTIACDTFRNPKFTHLERSSYRWCKGACRHFLNRIALKAPHGEHELLLIRLRHPAGRAPTGSPRWLLDQSELKSIVSTTGES